MTHVAFLRKPQSAVQHQMVFAEWEEYLERDKRERLNAVLNSIDDHLEGWRSLNRMDLPALRELIMKIREAVGRADGVAFEQLFEGNVADISDGTVIIDFDEGPRRFKKSDLKLDRELRVGDVVHVRCQLEVVTPRPLTEDEAKKWEEEHKWADNPKLKAKRGKLQF